MVATVRLLEYGEFATNGAPSEFIHILQDDAPSGTARNYTHSAIRPRLDGAAGTSTERWIRFKFERPFTQVFDFYFWCPGLVVPEGWELNFGTAAGFQAPTSGDSAIASGPVPTTKPERPNCGGVPPLDGDEDRYSDFIVLQARVRNDAPVGPMLGFDADTLLPKSLQYRFDWTEL